MPASIRWPFRRKSALAADGSMPARASGVSGMRNAEPAGPSQTSLEAATISQSAGGSSSDEIPPFGIKILVDVDGDQRDCVDIVAIHGLNGHREKTWRMSATGLNWLSDEQCLRRDMPNAWVLTFGYNSRTYFSRTDSDVQDFASELLAELMANRKTHIERQRPIVFICHSLGGIVFKQAVVKAHEQDQFYSSIIRNIRGVAFFGTPHRGSDLATWDHIAATLHRAGSLGYVTNTKLPRDLKVNAGLLHRVSESFVSRAGDFKIRSFYETEFIRGLTCRVVDRPSATLGLTNELAIASPAHHGNICKFASPSDPRYKTAMFAIVELAKGSEVEEETDGPLNHQEQACMRALNSDYVMHLDQVDDPVPGTCEWVLSHKTWLQWNASEQSALLWISADAGCGKSVLAKFLVNHFQKSDRSPQLNNVHHFFFKEGLEDQDNGSAAASALIHQLCSSRHRLIRHVMPKFASMPARAFNRFSCLWSILIQIMDGLTEDTTWVLDGLDECDSSSLGDLLKALESYVNLRRGGSYQNRLMIILLSRPHNSVQTRLQLGGNDDVDETDQNPGSCNKMRLRVEEETAAVARDITLFTQHKLSELGQQDLLSDGLLSRLQQKLVQGADLTFLWISLVIQLVEDAGTDGISAVELESILNTTKLNDVYERLLSATTQPLKTRKVLMIVLAAVRPLSLKEMCAAVEVLQDHNKDETTSALADYEASAITSSKIQPNPESHLASAPSKITRGFGKDSKEEVLTFSKKAVPKTVNKEEFLNTVGDIWRNSRQPLTNLRLPENGEDRSYDHFRKSRDKTAVAGLKNLETLLHKPFSNHLRRLCGNFVRIRRRRIYLVHQTARQFLLTTQPRSYDPITTLDNTNPAVISTENQTEPVQRIRISPITQRQWCHSIESSDANRYLLQVCADYIALFRSEKPGQQKDWTEKLVTSYLEECREDPSRAFFRYAASNWTDHYRPLRQSLDFSFDYLLNPKNSLFKCWILVHRSWNSGIGKTGEHRCGISIPGIGNSWGGFDEEQELARQERTERDTLKSDMKNTLPKGSLQDVLDHFHLEFGPETEGFDQEWLTGPRFWKVNSERAYEHGKDENEVDSGDETENWPGDSHENESNFSSDVKNLPDRIRHFRRQHRQEYLKNWKELTNPMSGNPSSPFLSLNSI